MFNFFTRKKKVTKDELLNALSNFENAFAKAESSFMECHKAMNSVLALFPSEDTAVVGSTLGDMVKKATAQ